METYCPYPDCSAIYSIESVDLSSLFNAICPQCQRLGRIKPLEIINKLQAKEEKIKQISTYSLSKVGPETFQVLLEDIRSLWNVGSIFRSADATAITQINLCGITGCPPSRQISKTALGAELDIPWLYFSNALMAVKALKREKIILIGLERNNTSVNLTQILKEKKIKKPICVAVGNEVAGLSPELIQSCDYICELPMKGKKESLNVASAFAVASYLINEYI